MFKLVNKRVIKQDVESVGKKKVLKKSIPDDH